MLADSIFYQALAKSADVPCKALPQRLAEFLNQPAKFNQSLQHARLQLPNENTLVWFEDLLTALKTKKIKQLILHLGFYEKSLMVVIKPIDIYKFWRSNKSVMDYL
jgi:hypothetical protein